jgi:chromosome segregation ATPase
MGNEKYLNYYVEILTGTMTDAVIRNVSLQANARVTEEVINDQVKRNEDLIKQVTVLNEQIKELKESNQQTENEKVVDLQNKNKGHLDRIGDLEKQLNDLNKMRSEYDNVKNQVSHLETFRSELAKAREENKALQQANTDVINKMLSDHEKVVKALNDQIEYLQLTPAKRKKIDAEKALVVQPVKEEVTTVPVSVASKAKIFKVEPPNVVIKDGGSF